MPGDGGEGTGGAEAASGAEKASSGSLPKASSWKALKANVRVESSRKAFARTLTDVRKNYGAQVVPEGQDAGGGEDNDDGSLQRDVGAPGTQRRKMQLYIHPEGSFRRNWDMSQALVLFYLAVMVPFRVGFDEPAMGPTFWFETLIDVYFIVDLFLNFATAYYEEPDLKVGFVTDLKSIAVKYIRTWFPIDVLACLPIDYVTRASAGELECSFEVHGCASQEEEGVSGGQSVKLLKLLRIFRLLKLLRLARVSALMERYQDELIYWQNFITSVRVVLVTLFLSHWLAAYYGIIGLYGGDYGHLDAKGRYMRCFYNAISTITTLGAPDTANTQEELGGAVAMFVGATVFSWLLTNIFTVINPDDSTKMYKEKMDCVVNFLLVNKLPRATASQIIGFYRRQAETGFDEKALLANLPFSLRAEVFNILFRSTIKNVPLFQDLSDAMVSILCCNLELVRFPANRFIYLEEEVSECMYIVASGTVAVCEIDYVAIDADDLKFVRGGTKEHADGTVEVMTDMKRPTLGKVSAELTRGGYFGEGIMVGYGYRTENTFAISSLELLAISPSALKLIQQPERQKHHLIRTFFTRLEKFATIKTQRHVMEVLEYEYLLHENESKGLLDNWRVELNKKLDFDVAEAKRQREERILKVITNVMKLPAATMRKAAKEDERVADDEGEGPKASRLWKRAKKLASEMPPAPETEAPASDADPAIAMVAEIRAMFAQQQRHLDELSRGMDLLREEVAQARSRGELNHAAPAPETAGTAGAAPPPETAETAGAAPPPETAGAAPPPEAAETAGAAPPPETAAS